MFGNDPDLFTDEEYTFFYQTSSPKYEKYEKLVIKVIVKFRGFSMHVYSDVQVLELSSQIPQSVFFSVRTTKRMGGLTPWTTKQKTTFFIKGRDGWTKYEPG